MKSFLTFAEALKGKQHKIDVDKDGKIEGEDLAKLRAKKIKEEVELDEADKATGGLKDACWKGYTAVGMKMKNGRKVPNCVPEETDLEEKMNLAKASMGDVIKDFKKSDAPQFAGKSVEKRREMAIAAKLSADRGVREEVEQIDELSKSTLGSYVKKASTNARINSMISKDFDHKAMTARKPSTRDAYYGLSSKHKQKSWKRSDNVAKAVDRLAKEEVELEEAKDINYHKAELKKTSDKIDSIVKGGGRVGVNDPLSAKLKQHAAQIKKMKEEVETTNESSAYGRISSRFKTFSGRSLDAAAKEHGDEAKKLQKEIEAQQKEIDRRKAAMKEEVKPMKPPFNAPYKKAAGDVKDKSGAVHTAASRAKHLAKTGMKTQTPVKEGVFGALAGGVLGGLAGGPLGAAAGAYLGHKAQQAGNNAKEVNKKLKKEEVEQIDELKASTLQSYKDKANKQIKDLDKEVKSGEYKDIAGKLMDKRMKGTDRAANKLVKEKVEELDEISLQTMRSARDKLKSRAFDAHMDDNKYAAQHYAGRAVHMARKIRQKERQVTKEEVEQIDELSFNTLASYASKVDQKDKQPLSKKRQAGYNSAAERMSQKAQTADLKKWGKISDSVEYNFDNEGNLMPNPVSFKQFLDQLDEIKMADLPSRKVSGRGYGTEYYKKEAEKDKSGYDDEKKEKSEVKRGRGRPVGSTSGARQKGSSTGKKRSGVEMTGYPLHLPNKN